MTDTRRTTSSELTITRVFDAPRDLVFRAWTEREQLARWLGPTGFTATSVEGELRPGGPLRSCIRSDVDGTEYWSSGTYLEIVEPERLVFTFAWEEPPGTPGNETLVTVTFAAQADGRTRMTFTQTGFVSAEDRDGHEGGWSASFDDLDAHLATPPQGDLRLLGTEIARRLLASTVPARLAYTALDGTPRVLPMWFHWTGDELVLATHAPSHKVDALAANPAVAVTIDTEASPPEALLLRGHAAVTNVDGMVPEYASAARRYLGEEYAAGLVAQVDRPGTRMARIAVRPTWAGVLDFQTWFPSNFPAALR